jgi:hypothetical protein
MLIAFSISVISSPDFKVRYAIMALVNRMEIWSEMFCIGIGSHSASLKNVSGRYGFIK